MLTAFLILNTYRLSIYAFFWNQNSISKSKGLNVMKFAEIEVYFVKCNFATLCTFMVIWGRSKWFSTSRLIKQFYGLPLLFLVVSCGEGTLWSCSPVVVLFGAMFLQMDPRFVCTRMHENAHVCVRACRLSRTCSSCWFHTVPVTNILWL